MLATQSNKSDFVVDCDPPLPFQADVTQVKTDIADMTGTGSGTGGDEYLLQEFTKMVIDEVTNNHPHSGY